MTFRKSPIAFLAYSLLVGSGAAQDTQQGAPQGAADNFTAVVTEILSRQTEGPLTIMGDEQRAAITACVGQVLADLPKGRKDHILAGTTFEEREARFGTVLYENHAEWLQNVAGGCASLAFQ